MGKPRRQVRCTLCTPHRWKGNAKDRHPFADARNAPAPDFVEPRDDEHNGMFASMLDEMAYAIVRSYYGDTPPNIPDRWWEL